MKSRTFRNLYSLLLVFLFALSAAVTAQTTNQEKSLELRFKIDLEYRDGENSRRVEMAPRLKVTSGREAEMVIAENQDQKLRIWVHPQLREDGLVGLEYRVEARFASRKFIRKGSYATVVSSPYVTEFEDELSRVRVESFVLAD